MTTLDFITELFCRVDDAMRDVPKHSQAKLYPSEIVTLAILFALKPIFRYPCLGVCVWADENCLRTGDFLG